jgi:hypothetical protein
MHVTCIVDLDERMPGLAVPRVCGQEREQVVQDTAAYPRCLQHDECEVAFGTEGERLPYAAGAGQPAADSESHLCSGELLRWAYHPKPQTPALCQHMV